MSITGQIATPAGRARTRRPAGAVQAVPAPRRVRAFLQLCGLVGLTAFGAAIAVGIVGLGLVMLVSSLGG